MKIFKFYNFNTDKMVYHSIKMNGVNWWIYYYSRGFGWIKLFKIIFKWQDSTKSNNKNYYTPLFKINKWNIFIYIK
jgi:hypothetical protein